MKTQIANITWFFSILLSLGLASGEALSQSRSKSGRGGGWGDEKRELALPITLGIANAARNQSESCDAAVLAQNIAGFLSAAGGHYVGAGQESNRETIPLEAGALRCLESALANLQSQAKLTTNDSANIRASYRP